MKKIILMLVISLMMVGVVSATEWDVNPVPTLSAELIPFDGTTWYSTLTPEDFEAGREYITILTDTLTLGDLNSIDFEQFVIEGYPLSINVLLDVNDDGVFESKKDLTTGFLTEGDDDVLKIEWAHNGATAPNTDAYMEAEDYGQWLNLYGVDGTTNTWLYSQAPGPGVTDCDFNSDILANWKAGKSRGDNCCYVNDSWHAEACDTLTINSETKVYGVQIESLGWIAASSSKVRNIQINGVTYYSSIQQAITDAIAGDTINVAAGTYAEDQIVIDKSLNIIGAGIDSSIIDGSDADDLPEAGLIRITADADVTFSGFTLQNIGVDPTNLGNSLMPNHFGIYAQSNSDTASYDIGYVKILGTNDIAEEEDYGVYFNVGKESISFHDSIITQTGANAILIERHTGAVDISNNVLDVALETGDAIFVMTYGGTDVTTLQKIDGNVINAGIGAGASGMTFLSGGFDGSVGKFSNVQITNNEITNLKTDKKGIQLANNGNPSSNGIIGETNAIVSGNNVTGTGGIGIRLFGLIQGAEITGNSISLVDKGVAVNVGGDAVAVNTIFENNKLFDNTINLEWDGIDTFTAENNWWGTNVKTEIQSLINGDVDFEPWCSEETCTDESLTDADNDGYTDDVDCDDFDPGISEATDGTCDGDSDSYIDSTAGGTDCDDSNVGITEASDTTCDGDGDGYIDSTAGGTDCDDEVFEVNPGAIEVPDNDVDDNCNGAIDEADASQLAYDGPWASTVKAALDWLFGRAEQDTTGVNIYLHQGWNTFKLPWFVLTGSAQADTTVATALGGDYLVTNVLSSLGTNYNYLAYYDGSAWQTYIPGDVNTFTSFPTTAGDADFDFHIYMSTADRLVIE